MRPFQGEAMDTQTSNKILQFFAHPSIGISGSIASIVSLMLAIIFYLETQKNRDFTYMVNPVRSILAKSGNITDLQIQFRGDIITGVDVVSVNIALWNHGKASIRSIDILKPIEINLNPSAPILSVYVNKVSRDIIDFKIDTDKDILKQGRIPISWKILEKNDGASLQIIYAGSSESRVKITGVIEDHGELRNSSSDSIIQYYKKSFPHFNIFSSIISAYTSLIFIIISLFLLPLGRRIFLSLLEIKLRRKIFLVFYFILLNIFSISISYYIDIYRETFPPFGF